MTSPLGFKARVGSALFAIFAEVNVRFTYGTTLADLLVAGVQPVTSPHACAEVGTWLRFERATARTEDEHERATIVPATRLLKINLPKAKIYSSRTSVKIFTVEHYWPLKLLPLVGWAKGGTRKANNIKVILHTTFQNYYYLLQPDNPIQNTYHSKFQ